MTYLAQWNLTNDAGFTSRSRAAITEQASIFKDDARPDWVALANAALRSDLEPLTTFQTVLGAAPGFADTAGRDDGTVDSSLISDDEIRAAVQADWPTVASLYYNADGTPLAFGSTEGNQP
jgi:hypothetical protein